MRREEVAALAGIGLTWYIRIELGIDARPSGQVLASLADVLCLNADERRFLVELSAPAPPEIAESCEDEIPLPWANAFGTRSGIAVIVVDADQTVAVSNQIARAVWRYQDAGPWYERNAIWKTFRDPAYRLLYGDRHADVARRYAGILRRKACIEPNATTEALIADLRGEAAFDEAWEAFDVRPSALDASLTVPLTLRHPRLGELRINLLDADVVGRPFRLRYGLPADEATRAAFAHVQGETAAIP